MSMTAFELGVDLRNKTAAVPDVSRLLMKLKGSSGNIAARAKNVSRRAYDYGADLIGFGSKGVAAAKPQKLRIPAPVPKPKITAPGVGERALDLTRRMGTRFLGTPFGAGTTTGGLGGAYYGFTHDREEPGLGAIAHGLIGAALGGAGGALAGQAFRAPAAARALKTIK